MKDNRATSQLMKFGLSLVGLCLCCSLVILAPALTHAANLETPSNGDNLSGIGVIRGWKCEAGGYYSQIRRGEPRFSGVWE